MSKDKQYRAFLKSKHNHEIRWTGNYYNTFKGAKADADRQRKKDKFGNEYYTEIKVLLIEERIASAEVTLNKKLCPMRNHLADFSYECVENECSWWNYQVESCAVAVVALKIGFDVMRE